MLDEEHGRHPLASSNAPFTCGISGKTYSMLETRQRVDFLARALCKELGWSPNEGSEYDKIIGVFSMNTIDTNTLAWATHRLGGISTPANAQYGQSELEHQLKDSGAKCLFTCLPLLDVSKAACKNVGIPENKIYILELPEAVAGGVSGKGFKTVNEFIKEGSNLPRLEELQWSKGEGARRTAFLCYSSGTSGLPKGVMIPHRAVIANVLQIVAHEQAHRKSLVEPGNVYTEAVLGLLPMSHIYSLVVICHASVYRGDAVIVLPKFEMKSYLESIQNYKIATLYLVGLFPHGIVTILIICRSLQSSSS